MSGLDILGKGHSHEAIHNFVNETETVSLQVSASPTGASSNNEVTLVVSIIIIHGLPGCTSLNHFTAGCGRGGPI